MANQEQLPPTQVPPKKKSRVFKTLLYLFVTCLVLITITIILIPYALSSEKSREWIRGSMEEELGVPVELQQLDFSWGKGFLLKGLAIHQPEGFGKDRAISVGEVHADLSFKALAGMNLDLQVQILDPKIHIVVNKQGKSNIEALFPPPASTANKGHKVTVTYPPGRKDRGLRFSLFPKDTQNELKRVKLQFAIRRAEIQIQDRQAGLERTLSDLEVRVGNGGYGDPIRISLETKILNEKKEEVGSFGFTGEAPILPDLPIQLTMRNSNFDLATLKGSIDSMLESPFSSFEGSLDGNLGVYLHQNDGELVKVRLNGDMAIKNLKIAEGPLGKGKGISIPSGVIRPRLEIDPADKSLSAEGTMADLGFLQIQSLPELPARALLGKEKDLGSAIGLQITIDLDQLAGQKGLLPQGSWNGKIITSLAAFLAPGWEEAKTLPLRLEVRGEQLKIRGPFLPEGWTPPRTFVLEGESQYNWGSPENSCQLRASAEGLGLLAKCQLHKEGEFSGEMETHFETERSKALWKPLVPQGMELKGIGRWAGVFHGKMGPDLLKSLEVQGVLSAPRLNYLGNDLEPLRQKIELKDGELALSPQEASKLNGGKFSFSASAPIGSEDKPVSFKLGWLGGKAGGGVIPVLRYAFPLLAGIPLDDLSKISGVDFSSIASIQLEGKGPLPKNAMDLNRWNGKGSIHLSKGGFQPSKQLQGLLKLLGQKSRITFNDAVAKFEIKDGKLATHDLKIGGKDGIILLKGWTSLGGTLNYQIDLTDIFKKSKRGRQILKARGDKPIQVQMTGSLTSPTLQAENFVQKFLEEGLQNAARGFLQGLGRGKSPGKALKDLLKGLKRR
ncbi:MAG TPA: hypothetical protein ENK02_02155 [Planctomycetes bacterium]|nr:hypothetical protein [Planctomycetota bacterium]